MKKNDINQKLSYQKLLSVLKGFLNETQKIDFDLADREHLLKCLECGAHEFQTNSNERYVCGGDGKELAYDGFITISGLREAYMKEEDPWIKTTYEYICPDCGVWLKEHFDEKIHI